MPTNISSVSTFASALLPARVDPARNPTRAATQWLRRDIIRGVFEPLERLTVENLAAFYEIGHSPMREAILMLSSSGLVVHEHQKGHRVASVSLADWEDVTGAYQRIYKTTLGLAVERGDDAWEERVILALHRAMKVEAMRPGVTAEQREIWQRVRRMLHHEVLSGSNSPTLLRILANLANQVERYNSLFGNRELELSRDHQAEHRAIVDALIARDADRLLTVINDFFAYGQPLRDSVSAALTTMEGRPVPQMTSAPKNVRIAAARARS